MYTFGHTRPHRGQAILKPAANPPCKLCLNSTVPPSTEEARQTSVDNWDKAYDLLTAYGFTGAQGNKNYETYPTPEQI